MSQNLPNLSYLISASLLFSLSTLYAFFIIIRRSKPICTKRQRHPGAQVWTEGCNATERLSPSVYRACVIDSGQEGKSQSMLSISQFMADSVVLLD